MLIKSTISGLALAALIGSSTPSAAITGAGCPDLPAYARAVGTVEMGEGACNMTMAEARRILAHGNPDQPDEAAPAPTVHRHKRHHHRVPRY